MKFAPMMLTISKAVSVEARARGQVFLVRAIVGEQDALLDTLERWADNPEIDLTLAEAAAIGRAWLRKAYHLEPIGKLKTSNP